MSFLLVLLAVANPLGDANVQSHVAAQSADEMKICRSETVTGSIMPMWVCMTAAERDTDEYADELASRNRVVVAASSQ